VVGIWTATSAIRDIRSQKEKAPADRRGALFYANNSTKRVIVLSREKYAKNKSRRYRSLEEVSARRHSTPSAKVF
jgi:hypothetical protein